MLQLCKAQDRVLGDVTPRKKCHHWSINYRKALSRRLIPFSFLLSWCPFGVLVEAHTYSCHACRVLDVVRADVEPTSDDFIARTSNFDQASTDAILKTQRTQPWRKIRNPRWPTPPSHGATIRRRSSNRACPHIRTIRGASRQLADPIIHLPGKRRASTTTLAKKQRKEATNVFSGMEAIRICAESTSSRFCATDCKLDMCES